MRVQFLGATALAMALASPAFAQTTPPGDPSAPASSTSPNLDEVVVTGSYLSSQAASASPVTVTTDAQLRQQAAFTLDTAINNLPINSGSQNNTDGNGQALSLGTTNVNLRGLGVSSTLVLLDGRRVAQSASATLEGDQFTDLNTLVPTIAIARTEVLKDGASSLYGSDAVAGVVNLITRRSMEGVELRSHLQATTRDGAKEWGIEGVTGWTNAADTARLVVAASYIDRESLSASKRRADLPLRFAVVPYGSPQTFIVGGTPRPDPACYTQAAVNRQVIAPAGPVGFCNFDFGDFFDIVAEEKRFLTHLRGEYDVSDKTQLYVSGGWAQNRIRSHTSPSQPVLNPPVMPASNPGNLFGRPVAVFGRVIGSGGTAQLVRNEAEAWRATFGVKHEFNDTWKIDAAYTYSANDYSLKQPDTLTDRYQAALNGVGGPNNNQFFNPLFGASNDPAVIANFTGLYGFDAESRLHVVDVVLTGELMQLPAGPLGIAVGYQHRDESLSYDFSPQANQFRFGFFIGNDDFQGSQKVNAGFVELNVPIIENLELQGALRYEDFGDDVNTLDPKIGLLYRPNEWLSLRSSWSSSFRSPSIFQQNGSLVAPFRVFDPLQGAQVTVSQRTKSDPNDPLEPQTSKTFNIGATFTPTSALTVSIDYWNFAYREFITPQSANAVVAANPNGPAVTRVAGNQISTVTTFFKNAGALDTDGFDVSAKLKLPQSALGQFTLQGDGTFVRSYDLDDPVLGKVNGLALRNFNNFGVPMPKFRGNTGVLWENGRHSANVFVRYIHSYRDDSAGWRKVKAFTTVDAQYGINLEGVGPLKTGPNVTIGVRNVFDRDPPDAVDRSGYDPLVANALGRLVYVSLGLGF